MFDEKATVSPSRPLNCYAPPLIENIMNQKIETNKLYAKCPNCGKLVEIDFYDITVNDSGGYVPTVEGYEIEKQCDCETEQGFKGSINFEVER